MRSHQPEWRMENNDRSLATKESEYQRHSQKEWLRMLQMLLQMQLQAPHKSYLLLK